MNYCTVPWSSRSMWQRRAGQASVKTRDHGDQAMNVVRGRKAREERKSRGDERDVRAKRNQGGPMRSEITIGSRSRNIPEWHCGCTRLAFLLPSPTVLTGVCGWRPTSPSPEISPISLNISKTLGLASLLSYRSQRRIANDDLSTFVLPHLAPDLLTNYDMKRGDFTGRLTALNYSLRQLEYEKQSLLHEVIALSCTQRSPSVSKSKVVCGWRSDSVN
jgi:hypothetical protein